MKLSRRRFLRVTAAGAAVTGVSAWWLARGYPVGPGVRARLRALSPKQFAVLLALASAALGPRRLGRMGAPDDLGVAMDAFVAGLPARARRDFGRLLHLLEHVGPLAAGFATRFSKLAPVNRRACLACWQRSRTRALGAGFQAVKGLAMMAYYVRDAAWREIGFAGPMIARNWPGPPSQAVYDALLAPR